MSESTASERSQPTPDSATANMTKEYPPTANMAIMAQKEGFPQPRGVSGNPDFIFQIGRDPIPIEAPEKPSSLAPVEARAESENSTGQINPSDRFNSTLDTLLKQGVSKHSRENHGRSGRNGEVPPYLRGKMPHYSTAPYGDRPDPFATRVGDLPPGPSRGQVSERSSTPALDPREGAFRFGLPPLNPESSDPFSPEEESPEARSTIKRASRLAGLPFVKTWMERAKSYVGKQSEATLQKASESVSNGMKIDKRLGVVLLGLAGIAMVLLSGRDGKVSSPNGPTAMPGSQYGPIERVYDRPQMTSVLPAEERAYTIDPNQNRVIDIKGKAPEGFKGKGPDTIVEDFSLAGDKQSVKGIVEDQLAQLLNPEYKSKVGEMRAQGKTVDPNEGWSSGTLEDFKTKLTDQFGEQKAKDIYEKLIDYLVTSERYTIEDYNRGKVAIAEDGDTVMFTDGSRKLTVLDMNTEGKTAIALAVKGSYSVPGDEKFVDPFMSNFKPGDSNGR